MGNKQKLILKGRNPMDSTKWNMGNKQKLIPEGRNPVEEQSAAQDQLQFLCIMPVKIKGNNKSTNRMTFPKQVLLKINIFSFTKKLTMLAKVNAANTAMTKILTPHSPRNGA